MERRNETVKANLTEAEPLVDAIVHTVKETLQHDKLERDCCADVQTS
jgi:hypothetical protein